MADLWYQFSLSSLEFQFHEADEGAYYASLGLFFRRKKKIATNKGSEANEL